jgi:hypothetical protein
LGTYGINGKVAISSRLECSTDYTALLWTVESFSHSFICKFISVNSKVGSEETYLM